MFSIVMFIICSSFIYNTGVASRVIGMMNVNIKNAPILPKTIYISPGGFKGVYMWGTCSYIKNTYNTEDMLFEGASAGSWNALFMVCKKNIPFELINQCIRNNCRIKDIELSIKRELLNNYYTDDFDLHRLSIHVATLQNFCLHKTTHAKFYDLEDAIDGCIASSHIPFITGDFMNYYKNKISFDGGAFKRSFVNPPLLCITPDIWKPANKCEITTLFSKHSYNFEELFKNGYADAEKNKSIFDNLGFR